MANFEKAYKRLGPNEGGYANHPNDRGGETWKGIARNFWPRWAGWIIIDSYKKRDDFKKALHNDPDLERHTQDFYKKNFWDVCKLDEANSQYVAENVFDCAVNCGTKTGAKFLQKAVNAVLGWCELKVDSIIGPRTLKAVNVMDEDKIINKYLDLRLEYYRAIVERDHSQLVFYNGWTKRVEKMRKKVG